MRVGNERIYRQLVTPALVYRERARELAGLLADVPPLPGATGRSMTSRALFGEAVRNGLKALLGAVAARSRVSDATGLHRDIEAGEATIATSLCRARKSPGFQSRYRPPRRNTWRCPASSSTSGAGEFGAIDRELSHVSKRAMQPMQKGPDARCERPALLS